MPWKQMLITFRFATYRLVAGSVSVVGAAAGCREDSSRPHAAPPSAARLAATAAATVIAT
jgi:hypothetical protein